MAKKKQGISATAWFAGFSAAGRLDAIAAPRVCAKCKVKMARWDSLWCSDACKKAFHQEIVNG